ncbi:MAG TPA: hypothetical protein VD999_03270 [Vitreimonas sp.]|nr:hypothetical protein [Vitreimonas sp.]
MRLFTRKPLQIFEELVARSRRHEIPANDVLNFIDRRSKADTQDILYIESIGYFLDHEAKNFGENEIVRDTILEHIDSIDQIRLAILAALGERNPYIWSSEKSFPLTQSLPDGENSDLIERYKEAVVKLYEYIESMQDIDKEEIIKFLELELAEYQLGIKTGKFHNDRKVDDNRKKFLEEQIPYLQRALSRLKQSV